jgi:hypothetical protein
MNAIQLLKNEHEKAKRAFGEIQAASAGQRAQLWAKLEPELKVHEEWKRRRSMVRWRKRSDLEISS